MTYFSANPVVTADVLAIVTPELKLATSAADLKTRLAKLGYGYSDTPKGRVLTTLPHGIEVLMLPAFVGTD